ncbi:MAG: nucleotidyl transferase AbiEii/AbiGii toxin family protein [Bacteroidales bacterium]|nr:nucleotidyl transferase AbiEii/AbiGii toxin family protein [Bacteroidales bacterium]
MIHPDSRSLEWIEQVHNRYPKLDRQLIEKSIRAFSLLESLARSGCPFIFKGGTCCMLHLNSRKRLSVDIDVICPPCTDITQYIDRYAEDYGFTGIELVERKARHNVPKSHAKFFYQVSYVTNTEKDNILLDVLFEETHYSKVVDLPITSPFLHEEGDSIKVKAPSAADILGDKLTAFAPHTTGVPFFKGPKPTFQEVIKQMYDIASLSDIVDDFQLVSDTFHNFVNVELEYRNLGHLSAEDVLKDAIDTAACLSFRGAKNPEEFQHLSDGIKRIRGFVIDESYTLEMGVRDSAKAAYLAAMILKGRTDYRRYADVPLTEIAEMSVGSAIPSKFNKLKKTHTEAFYYWAMTDKILSS